MADDTDLTQPQDGDTDLVKNLRETIKSLQSERDEATAQRMQTEKRMAFKDLGIDPSKGVGKLFYENYDGELSVDAVKAAATEYEVLGNQTTQTQQQQTQEQPVTQPQGQQSQQEQAAHAAINAAAEQGGTPNAGQDPTAKAWEAHGQTMQQTGSRDAAMAAHFGAKLQAAIENGQKQ
jgi:hypothetical protein